MEIENSIALRPKFSTDVLQSMAEILENAKKVKFEVKEEYLIKISDQHIFFFICREKRSYYSPHLHVELTENEDKTTNVRGLYGPDQTVWTFFMFLHFIIAGIFLIFSIIAYSHWTLQQSPTLDFVIMGLMLVLWFALYFQARINRKKCQPQMRKLDNLLNTIVDFG
ncbi:hypothetical protein [Flavobacterium sp. SM2513]|uniref:hypothetical protein n=1 Tax=Flavobacterium sp. SM2513 TaxID=3424766 RepID=UPI003D7FAE50